MALVGYAYGPLRRASRGSCSSRGAWRAQGVCGVERMRCRAQVPHARIGHLLDADAHADVGSWHAGTVPTVHHATSSRKYENYILLCTTYIHVLYRTVEHTLDTTVLRAGTVLRTLYLVVVPYGVNWA